MKLPEALQHLLHKKNDNIEMFLSLLLDIDSIQGAVWYVDPNHKTEIKGTAAERVTDDTWEERTKAADRVIGNLEDIVSAEELHKVVLGLPSDYLTDSGDIRAEVRPNIKKLTKELELEPIGFVSVHQAIVHKLKLDEGVPPSVILIQVGRTNLTVSLYKVGALMGQKTIGKESIVSDIEGILKGFKDLEVLPSRMLIHGSDSKELEEIKHELLKYPWPTHANFLHFPKIDTLTHSTEIIAVSLAGASEMSTAMAEEETEIPLTENEKDIQESSEAAVYEEPREIPEEEQVNQEEESAATPEESNVEMVEPEELGFKKSEDILEKQNEHIKEQKSMSTEAGIETEAATEKSTGKRLISFPIKLPAVSFAPLFDRFRSVSFRGIPIPFIGAAFFIVIFLSAFYWLLPHATVTILEIPKPIDEATTITINPTATVADSASKIVPGKKQEQSVNGEKVVSVTGKKQIGDPAKGSLTIYNKSLDSKTFPKGSVLSSGSLKFTLDSEVRVASASENIGSITFGKATANITASAIGTASNLPAGTEFNFSDYSASIAIARNDQPLTGGTSKSITVVSRADMDALVKLLTDELVEKAKTNLGGSVGGKEKLIDDTISTAVTGKDFTEELDQEATQLHGKLTVTVSGISYNEEDIATLMKGVVDTKLPSGYALANSETSIKVTDVKVKKDNTITAAVQFHSVAIPTIDTNVIKKSLAGKSIKAVQDYLRSVAGVGGVEFSFRWTLFKDRLPINANNISVTVAVQQ